MRKISDLNVFRAFRSHNYTLYFTGRSVSQFGTWMQRTAVVWVIYSATNSKFLLGLTVCAELLPSFLFSAFGGIAADRYDQYKIIKITQVASIIQAVLLAGLIASGHIVVWAILALSAILGVINAFDVPARQALVHEVVAEPADLPNALALTTAMASAAQLLGPALAGIVLSAFGAPVCFLLNAASFGAVLLSLLLMKLPVHVPKKTGKNVLAEFVEGFAYLKDTPDLGLIIVIVAIVSLLVLPYNTVLPVFAKEVFKGGASTYGYITSCAGAGAVAGTIFLASRKPGAHLKRILFISILMIAVGLIGFSQIRNFPLAMFFLAIAGFGGMAQFTVSNITVQSESAPQMRGRAIGILLMVIFLTTPLGSLAVGAVSQHFGAPVTVFAQGIIAIMATLAFARFLTKRQKEAFVKDVATGETQEIIAEH